MKYYYEIQMSFAPGMTWLRSPHGRKTWDEAFSEGRTYCDFAYRYRKEVCALRIVPIEE